MRLTDGDAAGLAGRFVVALIDGFLDLSERRGWKAVGRLMSWAKAWGVEGF